MMLFEVRKDGKVYYHTEHEELIPPPERIKQIIAAGYSVYRDGKRVKR